MKKLCLVFIFLVGCKQGATFKALSQGPGVDNLAIDEPVETVGDTIAVEDDSMVVDEAPGVIPPPEGSINPGSNIVEKIIAFFIENLRFDLAHDDAVRWDGCEKVQLVPGGYNSDTKCGRAFLHPSFSRHLNEHFYPCVISAADAAGISRPEKVFMRHVGTYNDRNSRNSSSLSMHAYARAMDITNFNLYDKAGKLTRVSTHINNYKGATAKFYDRFRACWRERIPKTCRPGQREASGSIGHTASQMGGNSLHADHIHLSYPLCGKAAQNIVDADEHADDSLSEENLLFQQSYQTTFGAIEASVRNDGHLLGQPFVVELRARCGKKSADLNELPVFNVQSACDVDTSSIIFDEESQSFLVSIRDVDNADMEKKSMAVATEEPRCSPQIKQVRLTVDNPCR